MILVAIVAEVMEEYTALLARMVEQVFNSAPVPRRVFGKVDPKFYNKFKDGFWQTRL
ncbi:hypothetical protein MtrunA17_Chr2g0284231 [Medicago truncatula]|uniref:Uncharacterized protein n=1 Tax=Medicago truncatula TaxID=3880 RepID=A0A396J6R9_MEDTR|nr:hypothetical protein MtrunA17_Chr2g0284231 [Medicago truncatula]